MRDPFWKAAWAALEPHLRPGDRVLLPPGEWPRASCRTTTYQDRIELNGADVLLLHKGKIGGLKKSVLRHIALAWRCVFANEVFVCFIKGRGEPAAAPSHLGRISQYVRSRGLKRIRATVFLVHLPKAAGTSVWNFLSEHVPSSIYYDTLESFLYNPPRRGEYDLVGGHVPLPLMAPFIGEDDRVAAVLREPTARFRSAFLHSRRPDEDPATFSPIMRAMRDQPLAAFLTTREGQMELRQQLLMLGHDLTGNYAADMDNAIHQNALRWISDERSLFRTVTQLDDLIPQLSALLKIERRPMELPAANVSRANDACCAEFEAQLPAIEAGNALERSLYATVEQNRHKRKSSFCEQKEAKKLCHDVNGGGAGQGSDRVLHAVGMPPEGTAPAIPPIRGI